MEVGRGGGGNLFAGHAAAEVPDVFGRERYHLAAGNAAAVDQIACRFKIDCRAGEQRAGGGEVAVLHAGVDLRHEHFLAGHFLLHQPHDVAGELGHLFGGEGNAGDELPGLGEGGTGVHQGLVLDFVRLVAGEEAAAGELGDLFGDQALFVEAVTEALLGGGGVEGELLQHVVAADPLSVIGEGGVGFDQVARGGVTGLAVEAVGGNAEVGVGADHRLAAADGDTADAASTAAYPADGDDRHRGAGAGGGRGCGLADGNVVDAVGVAASKQAAGTDDGRHGVGEGAGAAGIDKNTVVFQAVFVMPAVFAGDHIGAPVELSAFVGEGVAGEREVAAGFDSAVAVDEVADAQGRVAAGADGGDRGRVGGIEFIEVLRGGLGNVGPVAALGRVVAAVPVLAAGALWLIDLARNGEGVALVDEAGGVDDQVAERFDAGAGVLDGGGAAGRAAVAVEGTTDGKVAGAEDEGAVLVGERCDTKVEPLAGSDDRGLGYAIYHFSRVGEGSCGNRNGITVDAAGAEVVERDRINAGVGAVDEAAVGEGVHVGRGELQRVALERAGGSVVQRASGNSQRTAGFHQPAVVERASSLETHIAVRHEAAAVDGIAGECHVHVLQAEDFAVANQACGVDGDPFVGDHHAAGVGDGEAATKRAAVSDGECVAGREQAAGVVN